MQPVTAVFGFNVKNSRNPKKGEKNISQTTRTGFSEKSPLHTFSSQAFLIGKMQTAFVFKKNTSYHHKGKQQNFP